MTVSWRAMQERGNPFERSGRGSQRLFGRATGSRLRLPASSSSLGGSGASDAAFAREVNALTCSARERQLEVVSRILDTQDGAHAKITALDSSGQSSLHAAAQVGAVDVLVSLVSALTVHATGLATVEVAKEREAAAAAAAQRAADAEAAAEAAAKDDAEAAAKDDAEAAAKADAEAAATTAAAAAATTAPERTQTRARGGARAKRSVRSGTSGTSERRVSAPVKPSTASRVTGANAKSSSQRRQQEGRSVADRSARASHTSRSGRARSHSGGSGGAPGSTSSGASAPRGGKGNVSAARKRKSNPPQRVVAAASLAASPAAAGDTPTVSPHTGRPTSAHRRQVQAQLRRDSLGKLAQERMGPQAPAMSPGLTPLTPLPPSPGKSPAKRPAQASGAGAGAGVSSGVGSGAGSSTASGSGTSCGNGTREGETSAQATDAEVRARARVKVASMIDVADVEGRTPLAVAAMWGKPDACAYLLSCGANVHATSSNDRTPLHEAAYTGHHEVLHVLCAQHCADPLLQDEDGYTPHSVAVGWGRDMLASMLRAMHGVWFRRTAIQLLAVANRPGTHPARLPASVLQVVLSFLGMRDVVGGDAEVIVTMNRPAPVTPAADGAGSSEAPPLSAAARYAAIVATVRPTPHLVDRVKAARRDIARVPRARLDEVKSMRAPPRSVKLVLEAVCLVCMVPQQDDTAAVPAPAAEDGAGTLAPDQDVGAGAGVTSSEAAVLHTGSNRYRQRELLAGSSRFTFDDVRALLHQPQWVERVLELPPRLLPIEVLHALTTRYVGDAAFTADAVKHASSACVPLRAWVLALIEAHHDIEAQVVRRLAESPVSSSVATAVDEAEGGAGSGGGSSGDAGTEATSEPVREPQPDSAAPAAVAPKPRLRRPRRNMEPVPIQPAPRKPRPPPPSPRRARTPTPPPAAVDPGVDVMALPQPHDSGVDASPFELQMLRHHLDAVLRHVLGMDDEGDNSGTKGGPDLSLVSFKVLRRSVAARVGREQEFEEKPWRTWFKAEVNLQLERLL